MASPLLRRRGPRYSSAHGLNIFASYSYTGGPVRDLKTRAWLDRMARRRDAAVASDLVALGPPSQHCVGLQRRVDHRAASRTAGGTPRPRNFEAAWRCRHGLLVSGTTVRVLRDFRAELLLCIRRLASGRSQQIQGAARATLDPRNRPGPRQRLSLRSRVIMVQSFVCLRLLWARSPFPE